MRLQATKRRKVNIGHISFRNFETVGVGRWLDDEIINYFVTKWCSQSQTTLGLSTFFACKFLFQERLCIRAKTTLTSEDERGMQRWCQAAVVGTKSIQPSQDTPNLVVEKPGPHRLGRRVHPNQ